MSKNLNQKYFLKILLLIFILSYFIANIEINANVNSIDEENEKEIITDNKDQDENLPKTSVYYTSSMSYDSFVGYMGSFSAGQRIYWDSLNHDGVNIRVLGMTGSQYSTAAMGGSVRYHSLLYEGSKGYGYFTVPSTGQWAIGLHHRDSGAGSATVYWNAWISPGLTVTNPSSSNKWVKKGTTIELRWNHWSIRDVKIELWKGSTKVQDITSTYTRCDGSYLWDVPISLSEGADYRIKIINWVNPNIYDYSGYFEIYEFDSIDVTYPDSSSSFGTATSCDIFWSWKGPISNVKIELWNNSLFLQDISSPSTQCDGSFSWTIPSDFPDGTAYQIKVVDYDNPAIYDYSEFFSIYDAISPEVSITFPSDFTLTSNSAPSIDVQVSDSYLNKIWYRLRNNTFHTINYTWEGEINQNVWSKVGNGTVIFDLYANDTYGNIGYDHVIFYKDIIEPLIYIETPEAESMHGSDPPKFNLTITEANLNYTWYTINNNSTKHFFKELNGTIGKMWETLKDGNITIHFWANDTLNNIGWNSVNITKSTSSPVFPLLEGGGSGGDGGSGGGDETSAIPGYELSFLMISIIIMGFIISKIISKKLKIKT